MHLGYRDLLLSRVQAALGAARALAPVTHAGLRGQLREVLVRDLLRPLLPLDIGIATGQVISSYDQWSREQDVILYSQDIVPPILFESTNGLIPLESVLATIEVKSRLTYGDLESTHESAKGFSGLLYRPMAPAQKGQPAPAIEHGSSYLFALESDLTQNAQGEIERYDKLRGIEEPAIRALCVVGRGFWFWAEGKWQQWNFNIQGGEVLGFISSILNTYKRVAATRQPPDMRDYLLPN